MATRQRVAPSHCHSWRHLKASTASRWTVRQLLAVLGAANLGPSLPGEYAGPVAVRLRGLYVLPVQSQEFTLPEPAVYGEHVEGLPLYTLSPLVA